jgi:DNA repair photolyase
MVLDKSQLIGITESSEISFHLDVFDNLYNGNIIITKRLTNKLIDKLVEHKDKIILHFTVTGWGNSVLEPFVPTLETSRKKFGELIEKGFPIEHCVLRIDPIIPTDEGIDKLVKVVNAFSDTAIKRVRFSVLDMYDHVKKRFKEAGLEIPYETFHAPLEIRKNIYDILVDFGKKYNFDVEACAEPGIQSISCLSQKDIDILGLTDRITLIGNKEQRSNCSCPSNKKELIKSDDRAKRCLNKCLYCFWR